MILNAVLCDYFRITSFDAKTYKTMMELFRCHAKSIGGKLEPFAMMQYNGKRTNHGFLGIGEQKRGWHYMTYYSGAPAHIAWSQIADMTLHQVRCTRFDVQITIPLPKKYKSEALFKRLNGNVPYNRTVTLWKSGDGLDTVYIGRLTTKHGRVTRIYVKEYIGGRGLRFETQFNGDHANQHWEHLRAGGDLHELLTLELESLGDLDFEPLATFYALMKGFLPAPRPRPVETSTPTLDWLLNTCDPVIRRMLADHDHGWKVHNWLTGLLDWNRRKG